MNHIDYSKSADPVFDEADLGTNSTDLCFYFAFKTLISVELRRRHGQYTEISDDSSSELKQRILDHIASTRQGIGIINPNVETSKSWDQCDPHLSFRLAQGVDPESLLMELGSWTIESSDKTHHGTVIRTDYAESFKEKVKMLTVGPAVGFIDTDGFALDVFREQQAATHALAVIGVNDQGWYVQNSVGKNWEQGGRGTIGFGERGISTKRFYQPVIRWTTQEPGA
jgi:predicted small metal-binding protein